MVPGPINYRMVFASFRQNYGPVIFAHYFMAPVGILTILFFAYLTNLLIDLLPFTFPAQGIFMIILFLLLVVLHKASPHFLFHHFYSFLHPAADFLLACMGLFFTSSFVLIPRRDPMPSREIGLIAALFLPSFLVTWVGTVLIVKALARIFPYSAVDIGDEGNNADVLAESESSSILSSNYSGRNGQLPRSHTPISPDSPQDCREISEILDDNLPARTTVGPKHSFLKRPELNQSPLNQEAGSNSDHNFTVNTLSVDFNAEKQAHVVEKTFEKLNPTASLIHRVIAKAKDLFQFDSPPDIQHLTREEKIAGKIGKWFDPAVYFILLLIGLPLFFTPGGERRSLPLFTGIVSLSWMFSRRVVPATWQKLLHPILVTSFITVFAVWGFGAVKGLTLTEALNHYSTGATYLILFRTDQGWDGSSPGAGDLMSSLLVGGIVALAFPMFRYRYDLYNNFLRLLAVVAPNCALTLLLWPWIANKMGIAGDRAITFAGRFMSTPFGIQFIVATGGDSSLIVVLICITGIVAVLIRDPLFRLCRTRVTVGSDEYFTIGCTIGIVAAAIGTSSLMDTHSRAAATSTVVFVLYGLALLALVAIPSIAQYVGILSGI